MTKDMKGYAARFPEPLLDGLKAAARREGRSVNALLEDAASDYLAARTSGDASLLSSAMFTSSTSYHQPDLSRSARTLRSAGVPFEDAIAKLAGHSPEED